MDDNGYNLCFKSKRVSLRRDAAILIQPHGLWLFDMGVQVRGRQGSPVSITLRCHQTWQAGKSTNKIGVFNRKITYTWCIFQQAMSDYRRVQISFPINCHKLGVQLGWMQPQMPPHLELLLCCCLPFLCDGIPGTRVRPKNDP